MKIGDLVRLTSENRWRYRNSWCKEQKVMMVFRESENCIAFAGWPIRWVPKKYFEVISAGR